MTIFKTYREESIALLPVKIKDIKPLIEKKGVGKPTPIGKIPETSFLNNMFKIFFIKIVIIIKRKLRSIGAE